MLHCCCWRFSRVVLGWSLRFSWLSYIYVLAALWLPEYHWFKSHLYVSGYTRFATSCGLNASVEILELFCMFMKSTLVSLIKWSVDTKLVIILNRNYLNDEHDLRVYSFVRILRTGVSRWTYMTHSTDNCSWQIHFGLYCYTNSNDLTCFNPMFQLYIINIRTLIESFFTILVQIVD